MGKKKVSLDTLSCNVFERVRGLMFRFREKAPSLLFDFRKDSNEPLHSLFVFFPFIAVWFNKKKIVHVEIVRPFRFFICPKKPFTKILEIPMNKKYRRQINAIVGEAKYLKRKSSLDSHKR